MSKLNPGDPFPNVSLDLMTGGSLRVPDDLDGDYLIVLFYRGHW